MKKNIKANKFKQKAGFTVLFSIIVAAAVAIIGAGIFSVSSRQAVVTRTDGGAKAAYAVADAAIECALYQISVEDAFGDGSATTCNGQSLAMSASAVGNFEWEFTLSNINGNGCATVYIDTDFADNTYQIKANGVNDCSTAATAGVDVQEVQLVTELEVGKTLQTIGSPYDYSGNTGGSCYYAGYLWVATKTSSGFRQLDVSDPSDISLVQTISTPTASVNCAIYDNALYLSHDDGVVEYLLGAPSSPTYSRAYTISSTAHSVLDMVVNDRYVYLLKDDGPGYAVEIVQISDMVRQSIFDGTGDPGLGIYLSLAVGGNALYLGGVGDIAVVDTTNKNSPIFADSLGSFGGNFCDLGYAWDQGALYVSRCAVADTNSGIWVVDVSDPYDINTSDSPQIIITGSVVTVGVQYESPGVLASLWGGTCEEIKVSDVSSLYSHPWSSADVSTLATTSDQGSGWSCEQFADFSMSGNRLFVMYSNSGGTQGRLVIYDFKDRLESTYQD